MVIQRIIILSNQYCLLLPRHHVVCVGRQLIGCSADEMEGEAGTKYHGLAVQKEPGVQICSNYFCLLSSTINSYIPSPSHPATDSQYSRFSVKFFSWSALDRRPKNFFTATPNCHRQPTLGVFITSASQQKVTNGIGEISWFGIYSTGYRLAGNIYFFLVLNHNDVLWQHRKC
jgi:hypothetical protein